MKWRTLAGASKNRETWIEMFDINFSVLWKADEVDKFKFWMHCYYAKWQRLNGKNDEGQLWMPTPMQGWIRQPEHFNAEEEEDLRNECEPSLASFDE